MAMEESVRSQVEIYLSHLDNLIVRGAKVRDSLETDSSSDSAIRDARAWQEDCGVLINQLSGGSKSHWLARVFSQAFLMRSPAGDAVEGAAPAEIVERLLAVLKQAVATLSAMDGGNATSASSFTEAPAPRRFEFVHNPELRPVLERAYLDSRHALEQGDYDQSLRTSCGILEAIVTDALEHKGLSALSASGAPAEKISDWSFNTRLAVAEKAGLTRSGCARLPAAARTYRDHPDDGDGKKENEDVAQPTVSEKDARQAGQVLHVIMRDLDPSR